MTRLALAVLLAATPGLSLAQELPPEAPAGPWGLQGSLLDRFLALTENEVATDAAWRVAGAVVQDAHMRWELKEGTLAPIRTAGGVALGAWFQGSCTFSYTPPLGQEAAALERFTRRRELKEVPCTEAHLLTDDPEARRALGLDGPPPAVDAAVRVEASPWLRKARKRSEIFKLDKHHYDEFAVHLLRRAAGALEPGDAEVSELRLSMRVSGLDRPPQAPDRLPPDVLFYERSGAGGFAPYEHVALVEGQSEEEEEQWSLSLASHPLGARPEGAWRPSNMDMVKADLDLGISVGLDHWAEVDAKATVTLTAREVPLDAVVLDLLRRIRFETFDLGFQVSSVTDWKGRQLDYLHHGGNLLVRLRAPLPPGQAEVLTVAYAGNAMPRYTEDSFGLLANYPWWPQPTRMERLTWSATLCAPPAFSLAGTGTVARSWTQDGKRCERWEEPVPVAFPAVNMGRWEQGRTEGPRGVRIRAFFLHEDVKRIDPVLAEAKNILKFYESVFGPYPYAELDIAEAIPNMGFWQAPAGLVELSKSEYAMVRTAEKDRREDYYPHPSVATLAHEIAHQWWGHVVGWKSYRDQWVSETFAEYASFLYMTQTFGKESYLGRLEWWEEGGRGARESDAWGPPVLGGRLAGGRIGQFYSKGPHVLHMLRRLVGDRPFLDFLRGLATVAPNSDLSTEELHAVAKHVLGPDVDWFFDQWLYRTGLPELEAAWRVDGKEIEVRIDQKQHFGPMRLLVPVAVTGKRGKPVEHVVLTDAASLTVRLPLPAGGEVKKVELDPDREVLTASRKTIQLAASAGGSAGGGSAQSAQ